MNFLDSTDQRVVDFLEKSMAVEVAIGSIEACSVESAEQRPVRTAKPML